MHFGIPRNSSFLLLTTNTYDYLSHSISRAWITIRPRNTTPARARTSGRLGRTRRCSRMTRSSDEFLNYLACLLGNTTCVSTLVLPLPAPSHLWRSVLFATSLATTKRSSGGLTEKTRSLRRCLRRFLLVLSFNLVGGAPRWLRRCTTAGTRLGIFCNRTRTLS